MLSNFARNATVGAWRCHSRRQMGVLAPLLGGSVNQNGLHEEFSGTPARVPMEISTPTVESSTSNNGIQVTSEDSKTPLTTVTINIGVGSRDTSLATSGAALLLKHMQLSTTSNRSKLRIQRELDEIGASVSTSLGRENITIHASAQAQYFTSLIEILGDSVSNMALKDYEVAAVLPHVQHEVTHSDQALNDAIHGAAFYDSVGLGLPIHGSLAGASRDAAAELARSTVLGSNISIAVTGADHDQVTQGVNDRFANIVEGTTSRSASEYVGGETRVTASGATQIAVGLNLGSSSAAAAKVLATILGSASHARTRSIGGVTAGRAASVLASNDSLTQVSGFAHTHSDGGIIGLSATTNNADESAFSALTSALKAAPITDDEVAHAKAILAGAAAQAASSQSGRAAAYIAANVAGQVTAADIAAVATADVNAVLTNGLKSAGSFATVGDITNAPRYNVLSKLL